MIVHSCRLVALSAQPAAGDGGSRLTEVVMSLKLGSLHWVHCRVMLLHNPMVAVTFAENGIGSDPTGKIIVHFNNHNNTIFKVDYSCKLCTLTLHVCQSMIVWFTQFVLYSEMEGWVGVPG